MPPPAARKVEFVKDIQPIFESACYECHGPRKQEAGLRLDHKPTVFKGGELGPAVTAGKSADSLLIHFVAGLREEGVMPKKGERLSPEQIGVLRAWMIKERNGLTPHPLSSRTIRIIGPSRHRSVRRCRQ